MSTMFVVETRRLETDSKTCDGSLAAENHVLFCKCWNRKNTSELWFPRWKTERRSVLQSIFFADGWDFYILHRYDYYFVCPRPRLVVVIGFYKYVQRVLINRVCVCMCADEIFLLYARTDCNYYRPIATVLCFKRFLLLLFFFIPHTPFV